MSKTVAYSQWLLEPYCIGLKLRALRNQKRLTLAQLAAETGLSTALLSKLETDRMIPTLPTLATIGRVYGVGMSHFFAEPGRHTLSITRRAHLEGASRGQDAMRITPLNAATDPKLLTQMIEFAPGGASSAAECLRGASGVIYVLEGSLVIDSGGMEEVLEAGDCACLESDIALNWSAGGKDRCRILAVASRA
jgi:transcriptional regulator with XRE-family HTH domain